MFVQLSLALYPNLNQHFGFPFQFCLDFSCLKRRMSVQSSFSPSPNPSQDPFEDASQEKIRQSTNINPSIWGDRFIRYSPAHMTYDTCLDQVETLKKVRRMLVTNASKESSKKVISLIDLLQRLGIAYHFDGEIEEALEQIQYDPNGFDDNDLYAVALQFRLLRQRGYNVPCDIFNRFRDNDGNFKEDLINDVSGMLCLYEATHLRLHGEHILDEAMEYTTARLKSMVNGLKPPLATQVMHALKQPLHKGVPRLEARHYISVYQEDETKNESILKFAKLDFNLLQSMYQQELSQLSSWWKEADFASKLPYARDRLVECYFWIVGMYFEPHYALARKISTKILALYIIIDDIYDAYGTIEELELFTDAIERWDYSAINGLPTYMKVAYSALLDVYNEAEEELRKEGQSYNSSIKCAKELMKTQVRAFFVEARWFNDGYIPTFEEYMQIALITISFDIATVFSMVEMGDIVTEEVWDWIVNEPKIARASNWICRLMNDMTSHKFEKERGHVCRSAIECYMKQYDIPEQEVVVEFNRRVVDAWKDINQACMKPSVVPMPILSQYVNHGRIIHLTYKDTDGCTFPHQVLKESITSLFIDAIPM